MLRTILALAIAAHGIGHIVFLIPLLGFTSDSNWGQSTQSWLFTHETLARVIGTVIWVAATVAFCAAAYGLFSQMPWWRTAAVAASIASLVGLALFWVNPISSSAYFALGFDVVALASLLIAHWPTVEAVGA